MEPLRSLLFVPGNRPDMLGKAAGLTADALVPDLEDSVPLAEKSHAREATAQALPNLAQRGKRVIVRVNSLASGLLEDDLTAVVGPHIYAVNVPKVESPWIIQQVETLLARLERQRGLGIRQVRLIPWIETAKGVVHAYQISSASPRIVAVSFGAEDLTVDMETHRTAEGAEVLYARSAVALAAHAAGVLPLDTPYLDFRDSEGLQRDAEKGAQLGYRGKFAIHPSQLDTINRLFSPSPEAVDYARRVVRAFEEAESQGRGAISLDGKVIDVPVVKRARNILALAEVIQGQARPHRAAGDG